MSDLRDSVGSRFNRRLSDSYSVRMKEKNQRKRRALASEAPSPDARQLTIGDFELFCQVIETGGFRQAGKQFNITPSQISRRVQHMEECVGGILLERTTRSMRLTALGKRFLSEARQFSAYSQYLGRFAGTGDPSQGVEKESLWARAKSFGLRDREEALSAIANLCSNPELRWLSITGPGGIGKTLLHRVLHAEFESQSSELTTWCDLSSYRETASALLHLSARLGVACPNHEKAEEHLIAYLRLRPHVLLLDNLEQLSDVRDVLEHLLERCRDLRLIVTTRVALGSRYETNYRLEPLAVPPTTTPTLARARTYAGYRLFEDALARCADQDAALRRQDDTERFESYLAGLQRSGGLPLAIELLAGYCAQLPVERSRELMMLGRSFHTPPAKQLRHDSLYACFRASWEALDQHLQDFLILLSLVGQPVTHETCVEMPSIIKKYSPDNAMVLLARRSFLEHENNRFRLLPPIRDLVSDYAGQARVSSVEQKLLEWATRFTETCYPLILRAGNDEMQRVRRVGRLLWVSMLASTKHNLLAGDVAMKMLYLARLGLELNGDYPERLFQSYIELVKFYSAKPADNKLASSRWWDIARMAAVKGEHGLARHATERAIAIGGSEIAQQIQQLEVDRQIATAKGDWHAATCAAKHQLQLRVRQRSGTMSAYVAHFVIYLAYAERWGEISRFCKRSHSARKAISSAYMADYVGTLAGLA
ncbi:MAG: LysR family transcriptional regulator, partial [Casimicrobium sp.]